MSPGVFTDVQKKKKWSRNNGKEQEGQEFLLSEREMMI